MRIALGCDHAGYEYKERIKEHLLRRGHEPRDFGTHSSEPVDYPDFVRPAAKRKKLAGIRISPGGYFAVAALLTFAALLCLRTHRDLIAVVLIAGTWTIIPLLVLTNRLSFDGHTISRTGLAALLIRLVRGRAQNIAVEDVERVEVATLRTLRRGGKVRYRYRIEIAGKGSASLLRSQPPSRI